MEKSNVKCGVCKINFATCLMPCDGASGEHFPVQNDSNVYLMWPCFTSVCQSCRETRPDLPTWLELISMALGGK